MSTVSELYEERKLSLDQTGVANSEERNYLVTGVTDELTAVNAVRASVSYYSNGIPLDSVEISEMVDTSTYKVVARYARSQYYPDSAEEDTPTMNFDCGAGSIHITKSINQTRIYGDTDAGGMIGWNGKVGRDKEIAGCDIPYPSVNLTYTKKMLLSALTAQYLRNTISLIGCTNNAVWKDWQIGEVMFMGFSYSRPIKGATAVMVTFQFSVRLTEIVTISGSTHTKYGHDYMWTLSKSEVSGGAVQLETDSVYIDQVVKRVDFSVLGL